MNLLTRRLKELKRLEYFLREKHRQHSRFKRIYESNNKKEKDDREELILLSDSDVIHFDNISKDTVDMLSKIDYFDTRIFDKETKSFTVNTYFDLLDTIRSLIDILEFEIINKNIDYKISKLSRRPNQN